jgi:hypothetical protein
LATNPSNQPQNPAPAPAAPAATQNPPPESGPKNPYGVDTAKYRVARTLLGREVDRGKVTREAGVKLNTVYNVTGELTKMGYVLPIHQKTKKVVTSPLTFTSPSPPATPATTPVSSGGGSGGAGGDASPQITPQNHSGGRTQQQPNESPPATTLPPGGSGREQYHPGGRLGGENNPPVSGSGGGSNHPVSNLGGSPQQR